MRSAFTWGVLVGVATYLVVGLGITVMGTLLFGAAAADLATNPGKLAFGCLSIFLLLFAFSAAGFFTGRATQRGGLGAVAGMVAFACYGALITLYQPSGSAVAATAASTTGTASPVVSPVAQLISTLAAVAILLGVAALMGWLGGRPGAQRARRHAATFAVDVATSAIASEQRG